MRPSFVCMFRESSAEIRQGKGKAHTMHDEDEEEAEGDSEEIETPGKDEDEDGDGDADSFVPEEEVDELKKSDKEDLEDVIVRHYFSILYNHTLTIHRFYLRPSPRPREDVRGLLPVTEIASRFRTCRRMSRLSSGWLRTVSACRSASRTPGQRSHRSHPSVFVLAVTTWFPGACRRHTMEAIRTSRVRFSRCRTSKARTTAAGRS